jgi:hypothetical protein
MIRTEVEKVRSFDPIQMTMPTTTICDGQLARTTEEHEAYAAFNDGTSNSLWKTAGVKDEGRQAHSGRTAPCGARYEVGICAL